MSNQLIEVVGIVRCRVWVEVDESTQTVQQILDSGALSAEVLLEPEAEIRGSVVVGDKEEVEYWNDGEVEVIPLSTRYLGPEEEAS